MNKRHFLFEIKALVILQYFKKNLFLIVGMGLVCTFFVGCGASEQEIVVVASELKLETTADLSYDHMVLEISFEPNLKKDQSKKGKDSKGKDTGFLISRTEDVEILPESEINRSYLNLDRFEDSLAYRNKAALDARPIIGIPERLRVADKKLIFGGKGFDTRDFEKLNDGKLSGDFSTYINSEREKPVNLPSKIPQDMNQKLRPEEKSLIFHNSSSALNDLEIDLPLSNRKEQNTEKDNKDNLGEARKIPETLVHLNKNPEELIQLRPKRNALDLLRENPSIIKDRFRQKQ